MCKLGLQKSSIWAVCHLCVDVLKLSRLPRKKTSSPDFVPKFGDSKPSESFQMPGFPYRLSDLID